MVEAKNPAESVLPEGIDPHSFEWFAQLGVHLAPVRNLLKRISFTPGQTIVDLGAGTGHSTEAIMEAIPQEVLKTDLILLVEPSKDIDVARARLCRFPNIEFIQQDANEFLRGARGQIDQIHFHNAIHLLSDEEKEKHIKLAGDALRGLGLEAIVTTFIKNGEPAEDLSLYTGYGMAGLRGLRERSKEIYTKVMAALREGKAEARKRLSSLEYKQLFERFHLKVTYFDDNSDESKMPITYEAFRRISAYWLWIEGVLPSAPYDLATEVLQNAIKKVWPEHKGPADVSLRNCAVMVVQKPA